VRVSQRRTRHLAASRAVRCSSGACTAARRRSGAEGTQQWPHESCTGFASLLALSLLCSRVRRLVVRQRARRSAAALSRAPRA
jgi:hypothetical protein